jgi:tRNA pseudouridine-54 N-methylase
VNLTLEGVDPNAMDVDLVSECVVSVAELLGPDASVDIVIAGDFVAAIRARTTNAQERERYTDDRTYGRAAARALTDADPPAIVVDAGFVVRDANKDVALETFTHEALHILTSRRGESLNDVRRRNDVVGVAHSTFVAIAGIAAEEFRVVRALRESRQMLASDFTATLGEVLDAFSDVIWSASGARHAGGSVQSYSEDVMTAFSNLVTMLAYVAAGESKDFECESELWQAWVAPTWPRMHGFLYRFPSATEETGHAELDPLAFELADLLVELLADVGFALEDDPTTGGYWFGPVEQPSP